VTGVKGKVASLTGRVRGEGGEGKGTKL